VIGRATTRHRRIGPTPLCPPDPRWLGVVALAALSMALTVVAPATAQSDTDAFSIGAESAPSTAEVTLIGTTTLDPGAELLVRV